MQMEDNLAVELYTYQLDNVAIFCSDIELHALWFWQHIPCHMFPLLSINDVKLVEVVVALFTNNLIFNFTGIVVQYFTRVVQILVFSDSQSNNLTQRD